MAIAFLQPLDNVLAVCLALIAAVIVGGGVAVLRPRRDDEVGAVRRQSWAIAGVALVVCFVGIAVFVVILELVAAASSS